MCFTTGIHYLHFSIIYTYHVIDNLVQQIILPSTVNTFEMIKTKIYSGTRFPPHGKAEAGDVRVRTNGLEMCVCAFKWYEQTEAHPHCMSLKTVDSGSRLKAGRVESLELLHPSKVIGLWVLCCLFVYLFALYVCVGRGTLYVHAPGAQFQVLFLGYYTPCLF